MKRTLPEGLIMRPPTIDDLEIVHELVRAQDLALTGEEHMTLERLRGYMTAPGHDLARNERLVFAQDGRLLASLYAEPHQHANTFVDLSVLPGYSDPRVGDYLLELAEERAREEMMQAAPELRVSIASRTYANNPEMLARYTRLGFSEVRRFWDMAIDLNEQPPLPIWPEGVELRPFEPERDAYAVFKMHEEAFSDHWGHLPGDFEEWRHRKIESRDFDPSLWFIACDGDQPVGEALCSIRQQGWVDSLGILRSWRRKGLGLALLHHAFGELYRRGQHEIMLGVDSQNLTGAVRLYERAGMHIKSETISFEKELRAGVELSTQTLAV
jgi:ribosomal protein S18 acetylase RimI-like enzyme